MVSTTHLTRHTHENSVWNTGHKLLTSNFLSFFNPRGFQMVKIGLTVAPTLALKVLINLRFGIFYQLVKGRTVSRFVTILLR